MNSAAANIKTITKRELSAYFASPVAYVFIVIFLLLTGFFTFMVLIMMTMSDYISRAWGRG